MSRTKEEIIKRLGKLKRELADLEAVIKGAELSSEKDEWQFRESFNSWKGEKDATGIIDEIRRSRKSTNRTPNL